MRKGEYVRRFIKLGVVVALFVLAIPIAVVGQDSTMASAPSRGIELGMSGGLLLLPGIATLPTIGVSAGVSLSDLTVFRLSFSHAGVGLFGVEFYGINFFDLAVLFETSWRQPFGVYGFGGISYILAGGLGESVSGVMFLGGLGVRLSPTDFMSIRLGDTARSRNGVLNVIEASISFRF